MRDTPEKIKASLKAPLLGGLQVSGQGTGRPVVLSSPFIA
jgi:hypothetical protein